MLVVQPTASRFEAGDAPVSTNEHLLERISATENRITRLAERLERSLDLVLRQAQNSHVDRSLVKALIDVLAEDGLINKRRLEQLWSEQCDTDQSNSQEHLGEESTHPKKRAAKKRAAKSSRK
jgi:hypothetical protein